MPTERRSRSGRHRRARALDRGAVLDQALDPAERGRALPELDPRGGRDRRGLAALDAESTACRRSRPASGAPRSRGRDARAGPGRAPARRSGAPRRRSARNCALAEARSTRRYSVRMPRSSSQASNGPRIAPASWRSAVSRCQKSSARARDQRARDHVAVAVQVFGRRVHDEIGAELQRPAQHRRRRGAVDREPGAGAVRDLGRGRDVGDRPGRVGRRLDPDELGRAGTDRGRERAAARSSRRARPSRPQGRAKVEEPVAQAPVHDLGRQHVVAGRQRLEDRWSRPPCRRRTAGSPRRPRARSAAPRRAPTVALSARP